MKNYLIYLLISLTAVFTPVLPLLLTVGFLIAADFFVGLYKAYKLKQEITSRKLGHTVSKMLLYQVTILSLFLFETFILDSVLPITKIGAGLIAVVEIKSISESVEIMTGLSIWKRIVKVVKRGTSETKDLL